jgi:hypothetical protein
LNDPENKVDTKFTSYCSFANDSSSLLDFNDSKYDAIQKQKNSCQDEMDQNNSFADRGNSKH